MRQDTPGNPWSEILERYLPALTGEWDDAKERADPFAAVTMACLQALATREAPDERYRWKMSMFRRLYESGYPRQQILDLLAFVDRIMWLPPELEEQFEDAIALYKAERS